MPDTIINSNLEHKPRNEDDPFLQELDNEERSIDSAEEETDYSSTHGQKNNDPSDVRRVSIDYLEGQEKRKNYDLGVSRPGAFAVKTAPNVVTRIKETKKEKEYDPSDDRRVSIDHLEGPEKRRNYDLGVSRPGAFSVKAAPSVTASRSKETQETKTKIRYAAPEEFLPRIARDEKGREESNAKPAKQQGQLYISSQLPPAQRKSEYGKKSYNSQSEGKRRLSLEEIEENVKKSGSYNLSSFQPGAFAVQGGTLHREVDVESNFRNQSNIIDPSSKRRVSMDRLENEAKKSSQFKSEKRGSASSIRSTRRVSMDRLEAEAKKNGQYEMKKSGNMDSVDSNRLDSLKRLEAEAKKNDRFKSENRKSVRSSENIEEFIARKQLAFGEPESVGKQPDQQKESFKENASIGSQQLTLIQLRDAEVPSSTGGINKKLKDDCTYVTNSRIIMTGASPEKESDPEKKIESGKGSKGERKVNWRIFQLLVIIILITIGIGVGFGITKNENSESRSSARDQCKKSNRIRTISSEAQEAYWKLLGVIVSRKYIENEEEIDSCSARNIALHLASSHTHANLEAQLQRYLLFVLYLQWEGDNWESNTGWMTESSECNWHGVTCIDGFVVQLELPVNNIRGKIERELFLLDSLEKINLYDNVKLVGSLPTELGLLSNLIELDMQLVDVGDNLPTEIGGLSMIEQLSVAGSIADPLPSEIGLLTNLEILRLYENEFTFLPTEIGALSHLKILDFRKNRLTSLPSEIFELSRLTMLSISNNVITGNFPEITTSLPDLERLDISQNSFDGSIPFQTFDLMTNLVNFQISQNLFSGSIPSQIAKLTKLIDFNAEYNLFSGSLPTELGLCLSLENIQLKQNKIEGTVPTELINIPNLETLTLSRNKILGEISKEQCEAVRILDIDCKVKCPCDESCKCSAVDVNGGYVNENGQ